MPETDVVIIGAGLAGLAAAAAVRDAGRRALVLEASGRIGGRAWTAYPASLGGVWFDMGAVWFHDAEHNPLVGIARAADDGLLRSDDIRVERTFIGGSVATAAELADYDAAWVRYTLAADAAITENGDVSLAAVTRRLPADPWAATIEAWEGPVICAAAAEDFSALDWRRNALDGSNLVPEGGIGAFVRRRLTRGLEIRLNAPVRRVRWGKRVTVEGTFGAVSAGACIVTASTGVLASGALGFDPALPEAVQEAIAALPMGLAMKVALRATGTDRLDLPLHCAIDRQVPRQGEPLMPFQCWPFGRDYVQGWIGGPHAWELARAGDATAADFALAYLRGMLGGRVDRVLGGGPALVTHWEADPWVRGAYCYARVGAAAARERLAEPLADGRLMFAGEACNVPWAGTLAGAWISGCDAAGRALAALSGQ
ncbi:MAG TPA: NAD(P)/FAD-dependent oxidoreductase [Rhodopila sp.]|nr:NAD(P)/FAD-dependent oxidoreductase [Rhodopila sp.]